MKRLILAMCCAGISLLGACGDSGHQASAPAAAPAPASESAHAAAHAPTTVAEWAKGAQLFEGLGNSHRKITTTAPEAQKYFDQGMRLMWAFNHDEATRSFAKAAELDPHCAICYWGAAFTVGPNYNLPVMIEVRAKVAFEALHQAQQNAGSASPAEQALIAALAARYPSAQPLDPSNSTPVLTSYAEAMRGVATRFPDDLDVQTLYAEALMTLHAWKLWTADGKPAAGTQEILATLESVLKRDPRHPGANHYYVHAMEASPHPEKAMAAAERLKDMMPGAGHLVHMPAHIMQRVGRYEDAAEANRKAAAADQDYYAKTSPPDYYAMYTAHNYQFLAASAAMEGRKAETLEATRSMRKAIPDDMLLAMPGYDWPLSEEYSSLVRFGLWDEMIASPPPNAQFAALTGGYLYARGVALAAKGRIDEAISVLTRLQRLAQSVPPDSVAGFNSTKDVLAVAIAVVKARIADADKRPDEAIAQLKEAVAREDQLAYDEPSDWFVPTRQLLGAQLLKADKAADAEAVYREDLKRNPDNGWSLFGLARALEAQNKVAAAAAAETRFKAAWKNADMTLAASAF